MHQIHQNLYAHAEKSFFFRRCDSFEIDFPYKEQESCYSDSTATKSAMSPFLLRRSGVAMYRALSTLSPHNNSAAERLEGIGYHSLVQIGHDLYDFGLEEFFGL